ncbi:hypothetical protein [Thermophilibacter provencensis]|uniref:Uncharacterized protein n=1 Tax=Thermophilibacter provencensis TaxID=1852386 RepID=A0ABT7V0R1_9ACTN|nr:hypothetical protein [Thermophilibacter provencensis]MDM8270200.1 hypothetical protein [Thermophilibacter provencensis]
MDVQAIIAQVSAALAEAPEKVQGLLADPKGTIEEITGLELGEGDLSQIVDGVKSGIADGSLDISKLDLGSIDLGSIAGNLGGMLGGLGGLFGKRN